MTRTYRDSARQVVKVVVGSTTPTPTTSATSATKRLTASEDPCSGA